MRVAGHVPDSVEMRSSARRRSPLMRGLRILEMLGESSSTTSEIARELEVNRSSAHRLLQELEAAGYVVRDPETRRYSTAPGHQGGRSRGGPAEMGSWDQAYAGWSEGLYEVLSEIRDVTGEGTMFAVPAGDRMLYAAFYPTEHPVGVQESIGSSRPMHASAVGKAYLATLGPAALDVLLGRLNYGSGTELAAKGPLQLREMLSQVRQQGYAVDHDETFEGLSCVATPVLVNGVILSGSAGITGPTHRFSAERVERYGDLLVQRVRTFVPTAGG